jgi:uncharacterized membrane protein
VLTVGIDIINLKFVLSALVSVTDDTDMELLAQTIESLVSVLASN